MANARTVTITTKNGNILTKRIIGQWCMSCRTRHSANTPHDEQLTETSIKQQQRRKQ